MTFDYTHFPVILLGSQTAKLYMLGKSALFFFGGLPLAATDFI